MANKDFKSALFGITGLLEMLIAGAAVASSSWEREKAVIIGVSCWF